jgi:hypothetical protein
MRSEEGPSKNKSTFESGALSKDKGKNEVMIDSDSPNRSNYYKYKNEDDAQEAYDSLQAESQMRAEMGIKKGGKIDLSQCKVNTAQKNSSKSRW